METPSLPEGDQESLLKKPPKELSRVQKWTRALIVGLFAPLAASTAATAYFERSHAPVAAISPSIEKENAIPGTFSEEQRKNPTLTDDGYLDLLAAQLNTPERLGRFFDERIPSSPKKGVGEREEAGQDHWQTPQETVRREDRRVRREVVKINGQYTYRERDTSVILGDCEDYSFLAQEILWRQGKVAHVVHFPGEGHASCVWIEKKPDGQYHGFSLDNYGLHWNGEQFRNIDFKNPPRGFNTLTEAFTKATNFCEGPPLNPACIPVDRMRGPFKYIDAVTLQSFNNDLPHLPSYIDFLIAMGICSTGYSVHRLLKRRKNGETWKDYFTTFRLT